jgi:nucleotide-binding universal stress UspA family protein
VSVLIVGYDDSEGARAALDVAVELAGPLGDALLVAFAAQPPGRQVGDEYSVHLAALQEHGRTVTDAAVSRARAAGVEAEAHVAALSPAELLTVLAEQHGARAIVVGTSGESPLRGAVLGSTPHKLLQVSRVPVVAVPARG